MDFQQEHWQETKKKLVRSIKDSNHLNYLINQQIIFHQNCQKQVQKEREKREIAFMTKEAQIQQLQAEVERLKKEVLRLFTQQKSKDTEAIKFQQQIIELKEKTKNLQAKNQTLTQSITNLQNLNQQQKQTIQDLNQIIHQKDQQLINQQQTIQQQAQRIKELENKPPQVTVKKETVTVDNLQQKEEIQHLKVVIQELETKLTNIKPEKVLVNNYSPAIYIERLIFYSLLGVIAL
jgi:chromosome segregation ATPase